MARALLPAGPQFVSSVQHASLCLWIRTRDRFRRCPALDGRGPRRRGKYIGAGDNAYSAVHFDDLAALYCAALKKAGARTVLNGVRENVTTKQLAGAIHRGMGFKGDPSSLSLEEARRYIPIADQLTRSHALSGDLARTLGWRPSQGSILKDVEQHAAEMAFASRHKLSRTECRTR